jgi:UDP-N-acetylmuramate--alanine ligase
VARLAETLGDTPVTTYGLHPGADLGVEGLRFEKGQSNFDILVRHSSGDRKITDCHLPVPGLHNVSNALAAVAVALHLGVSDAAIRSALAGYRGVGRRFTRVGEAGGIAVIDDYGHHPVEIAATIAAARQAVAPGARVIAVHQPHRFTRLSALFDQFATCFDGADAVGLLPVYSAGEDPIPGATTEALIAAMAARGRPAALLTQEDDLAALARAQGRPGDLVLCLGAGTISAWAQALPGRLAGMPA